MNKNILSFGIIFLLFVSALTPVVSGYNSSTDKESIVVDEGFDRYLYPEYFDCYSIDEIPDYVEQPVLEEYQNYEISKSQDTVNINESTQPLDGPMDSPWPMYCHDVRHTGRSPYSTAGNPGNEKWRFDADVRVTGNPVIDDNGIIYFGCTELYAIYPDGTLKWKNEHPLSIDSSPAIDENGILYVGANNGWPNYFYAIYSSNGTIKWKYDLGGDDIFESSPAIGNDGTIYVGTSDGWENNSWTGSIRAFNPDGTLKWRYRITDHTVHASPAIGLDGTVYCGSHNGNLYALYPNNGTLRWKYQTSDWVPRGACITDDGTIIFGSWNRHLYAVYPNGTLKWETTGEYHASNTPVIGLDGTIYIGHEYLAAINPDDGSVKWAFDPGFDTTIRGGNPCISADGTIIFGTHIGESDGGELIAVNPDGTEKWRIMLATLSIVSAPAIGSDGTIYVGSWNGPSSTSDGYLHAIGKLDENAPTAPTIDGETNGNVGIEYEYTFKSISPLGREVYYFIDWGDNTIKDWFGPFSSGEEVKVSYKYTSQGTFTIKARAKDTENLWGPWGELQVSMPKDKATYNFGLFQFFEQFPILQKLISYLF
jgi:outer membrane protein assembly factor BamB